MATLPSDTTTADDFPARASASVRINCPTPARGVALDANEEAARRYGLTLMLSPEVAAERDRDYDAWCAYSAAMSRWIDGRGPRPQ